MKHAFVVAGTCSGVGKTTISLALMAAFSKQGYHVQPFKVGPDYIDPSLHKIAARRSSINLDTWMMPKKFLQENFTYHASKADISIIEGVMGLFDGKSSTSDEGSTAHLAKQLNVPVILIADAKSTARSIAALIKGYIEFDQDIKIKGLIFNNVNSEKHSIIIEEAILYYLDIPIVGLIPNDTKITLPSRHLGLLMGNEDVLSKDIIEELAALADRYIDQKQLLMITKIKPKLSNKISKKSTYKKTKVVAIAYDKAFCFYYEDNWRILEMLGYNIIFFSPMKDKSLPQKTSIIYFGGGYPELYADVLSENAYMKNSIVEHFEDYGCIYAECGGLMYLGQSIITQRKKRYKMCGCFPFSTQMLKQCISVGYVEIKIKENFFIFNKGKKLRGHTFHYSRLEEKIDSLPDIYESNPPDMAQGFKLKNALASYAHLHFAWQDL